MKADQNVQRQLLELSKVDAELSRAAHRRSTLPELAEVTEAAKACRSRQDAVVGVETAAYDLDREIARQEKEIESVRARVNRDRQLLESGTIAAKQLTDIEHEVETLTRRQAALEDDLLELMERREALGLDLQRTGAEVDKAQQVLSDAESRRDEAIADLDAIQTSRDADRAALVPKFPGELLALYDRARTHRGIGAALLKGRKCGSCQLELDRATVSEIRAAAPDLVVQCENCGAILVRTVESGV